MSDERMTDLDLWKQEVTQLQAMYNSALKTIDDEQENAAMWADKFNVAGRCPRGSP